MAELSLNRGTFSTPLPAIANDHDATLNRAFKELNSKRAWRKIVFQMKGCAGLIEVVSNDLSYRVIVQHAARRELRLALQDLGFPVPAWWTVEEDRKKGFWTKGQFVLVVAAGEMQAVIAFVHLLGREVLGWKQDHPLSARLQR